MIDGRHAARWRRIAAGAGAGVILAAGFDVGTARARSDAQPVSARYVATVAGVKIGEATITGKVGPAGAGARPFELAITAKYKVMLWSGRVNATSTGHIAGEAVTSSTFNVDAIAKQTRRAVVLIEGGTVRRSDVEPPLKTHGTVPMGPAQLANVADPLSGILIGAIRAASAPAGPCAGTLAMFTGWHRFDLAFQPATPAAVAGAGPATSGRGGDRTCAVTMTPIAGHKAGDSMVSSIARSRDIRAEFTRADASGIALPSRIRVPMWVGEIVIERQP